MTWFISHEEDENRYSYYVVTNGLLEFETDLKSDAEWLCTTLDDYETLKKKLDSLSRSVLCDNYGEC